MALEAVNGHAEVLRRAYPRVLARALSVTRNLPDAEDAVQEAVTRALSAWPAQGIPDLPEAWLMRVAANVHFDRLRKGKWEAPQQDALETLAGLSPWARVAMGHPAVERGWKDELLRLLFACCHPCLEPGEAAALCLVTVVGMAPRETAAAFVTEPRAMEQRLARARRRLRERGDAEGIRPEHSAQRMDAVLKVIYLVFNEGYWSSTDGPPIQTELCALALGLAHSVCQVLPQQAEATGLLALLMFHHARRDARRNDQGDPVPLPQQDRTRWDAQSIKNAEAALAAAQAMDQPGPFQTEAAISQAHCLAPSAEHTPWDHIAALYARLRTWRGSPAVVVNHGFAEGMAHGPAAGLVVLKQVSGQNHPYLHLVRGTLLALAGDKAAARRALQLALKHARNPAERRQIQERLEDLAVCAAPAPSTEEQP